MKIPSSSIATSAGGYIPEGLYRARCIGTKFTEKNSGGNPMTTLSCEIIEPETVEVDDKEITVAGRKFSLFLIHNIEKTGWASQDQVMALCKKLKISMERDENGEPVYETNDHKEYFHGLEFDIALKSEEDVKRYNQGAHKGKEILDGEGNRITNGWRIQANPDDVLEHCKPVRNEEIAAQPY